MRFWMMPVGILVVAGIMGCGTRPVDTAVSEAVPQCDEPNGPRTAIAKAEESVDNTETIEKWMVRVDKNREQASEAWKLMYEAQGMMNQWYELQDLIGVADVPVELRDEYCSFIGRHFPENDRIIDRRQRKGGREIQSFVEWEETDLSRIRAGFAKYDRFNHPSVTRIRLADEDLAVYRTILGSIARTNEEAGATSFENASVKRIETLKVGRPAVSTMMSLRDDSGRGEWLPDIEAAERGSKDAATEQQADNRLLQQRYVDSEWEPLDADSDDDSDFKLLPVHIVVAMDQHWLPSFLAQLANGEMSVDVIHVRVDGVKQDVSSLGSDLAVVGNEDDHDGIPVEILGVVRISNPPPPAR